MPIQIKGLEHTYSPGTPFAHQALKGVDLDIPEGEVTAIIGQTGSGKSTLVQHLNGLLLPTGGSLDVEGFHIEQGMKIKDVKDLRKKVGLVFQFPEYQLFEETIAKDIAFGPKNFGASQEEADAMVDKVLPMVGLDASFKERSPFELSGGQKRRVAIAGILALEPSVLVLDEPVAGLDPQGATEMMELFDRLNKEEGKTIILISHDMEHVLQYADNVVVMENGQVRTKEKVTEFFRHPDWMREIGINPPSIVLLKEKLQKKGFVLDPDNYDLDKVIQEVKAQVEDHA